MTDRKFDDVPIIAGDSLAGGLFGHGLLRKRAAEFLADAGLKDSLIRVPQFRR